MKDPLQAIVRFERAQRAVTDLTKRIGESLSGCSVGAELEARYGRNPNYSDLVDEKGNIKTHLWQAFNEKEEGDHGNTVRMPSDMHRYWLEDAGCEHCLRAFDLIQERKDARKELGAAKRSLRAIGRSAIKKADAT